MKKVLVIDTIIDDKSVAQIQHLKDILGENFSKYQFKEIHLATEKFSKADLLESDGILFSGSYKSVYESFYWKNDMHEICELVLERNKPTLATCFGAQFLGYHLGEKVVKNPQGTEFGPIQIKLTPAGKFHKLLTDYHENQYVFAIHQDIVEALPKGAVLLAHNENTPIQAYQIGNILATQFHCDLPTSRMKALLEKSKTDYLREGVLKDENHYQQMMADLALGESAHQILERFLEQI